MTSIANLFSNFDDLTKKKSVTDSATAYTKHKYNSRTPTPALTQGDRFKNYQKKIKKSLVKNAQQLSGKEGFGGIDLSQLNLNPNGLTQQSEQIINDNNYSSQQQTISNLQQQYQNTLTQYENLLAEISGSVNGYVNRVNPANPYLGKNVSFTTGEIAYVTQQGVVKMYPKNSQGTGLDGNVFFSTAGKNGCPIGENYPVNVPWLTSYNAQGVSIPSNPPLITGTPMTAGQSCGSEGVNVYVDHILNKPNITYQGCYADNTSSPLMTFIGGAPAPPSGNLQNGSFEQPQIASNSYQYISSNSTVPGWDFYAVLINNSSAWGYPMPYPAGNQALCIQATQICGQWIQLSSGTYTLSFYACGRPGYSGANTINVYCSPSGTAAETVYTFTPPTTAWQQYTTTFNISSSGNYAFGFLGTINNPNNSTAIQNITLSSSGSTSGGSYTYEMCKDAAINSEYQYFALQDVNPDTSQGYCAVSNNQPGITSLGPGQVPSGMNAVWASNTASSETSNPGSTAILSVSGALSVMNTSGQAVFSTPNSNANPSNYLGCYGDGPNRAMNFYNNGSQQYNNAQCQQIAQQNGSTYYGLQNSTSGQTAQCFLNNDWQQTSEYGTAGNCTQISDGSYSGGGYSNAVYNTTSPTSNYILILGDYYMQIQRGTSPSDDQGFIWGINYQKGDVNPNYTAANGTYGQNWISSGSTLAAGDWIGSPSGYAYLIMQSDGNLVLYTFSMVSNCQKMSDGKNGGGLGANAIYNIGEVGVQANMGKLAYIDQNSELHAYPASNFQYTNTYTKFDNTNSPNNDIPGAVYANATAEQCQTSCNNNAECAGFVFDSNNYCWPKNSGMYPADNTLTPVINDFTYIKNANPSSPPIGVPSTTNNTDSITYNNYANGGALSNEYGLANATSVQQQQLAQLQNQMNLLSNQISNLTGDFGQGSQTAATQMTTNVQGVGEYLTDLTQTNNKIKNYNTSIDNILQDSDITVLQKNYDYLFWSILAAGSVLVAMNIVKK
jgi:hypothetical protein